MNTRFDSYVMAAIFAAIAVAFAFYMLLSGPDILSGLIMLSAAIGGISFARNARK